MGKRRHQTSRRPQPHKFGHFPNAKRVRVRSWDLPQNRDDDVAWVDFIREPEPGPPPQPEGRKTNRK